ncbi:Tn3 family transposase [Nonomuraea aridisoli]|uniref:Tn3 transposase DDE domain-containing protein n=1 Tax=Nonomuraea aridisoli TaxID=2070368 RepID=A0A2W2D6B5_9ACTN|nr:Tn3 family transposase [Nonomuraea aridisoli]PZG07506.1 hypothetical protein C1J01_40540 [Nonomuraea aridisoli]
MNITYGPIAVKGVPALERHRLGYVDHTYRRADNSAATNPHLIPKQAGIGFAQALGGGLVAAIDGMRFVVPVPSAYARPNKKYFGPKRGITWLNAGMMARLSPFIRRHINVHGRYSFQRPQLGGVRRALRDPDADDADDED